MRPTAGASRHRWRGHRRSHDPPAAVAVCTREGGLRRAPSVPGRWWPGRRSPAPGAVGLRAPHGRRAGSPGAEAPAAPPRRWTARPPDLAARRPAGAEPAARWDVVHTHGMRANLPVRLALRGLRGRPCLFTTVHSDLRLDYGSAHLARLYQGLDRATLGGVDGIICVSDSLRSLLIARGYPAERLITVRSGLELPRAASRRIAAPAARRRPGARRPARRNRRRRPRVGTVARLVAVKDIDLTLEVADRLRRTHPQVEMIIVGDGPERDRLEGLATERWGWMGWCASPAGWTTSARCWADSTSIWSPRCSKGECRCRCLRPWRPACRW